LAVGLANLGKPVHIDDTLYLSIARQILLNPFDPYGGELNWQNIPQKTYAVSISPPLVSYYHALILYGFGESDIALHAGMIPWLMLAGWSLARLGDRWVGAGGPVAALVLCSPAVVVGTNLMLDTPLLACCCTAIEFGCSGLDRPNGNVHLILAGVAAAAAALIKYSAVALIPVFLVIAWSYGRRNVLWLVAAPIGALVAWQSISWALYGETQIDQGRDFLARFRFDVGRLLTERTLTMLALIAMTFPVWMTSVLLGRRRVVSLVFGLAGAGTAAWLLSSSWPRSAWVAAAFLIAVTLGGFGICETLLAGADNFRGRNTKTKWIVSTWIVTFAAFAVFFGPFVAVRSCLPIQPPLAILALCRELSGHAARIATISTITLSATLSALLAWADFRWAAFYPQAVETIVQRHAGRDRPILFLGHWGFQAYAQRSGLLAWDARWSRIPDEAVVVIPITADKQFFDPRVFQQLTPVGAPLRLDPHPLRLTTWNRSAGIRFYGGDFGEIPWGLSSDATEIISVFRANAGGG
jgi:4-amino-4-deoxy-L-arabinose transferase-like glycosyltransferase